jgi:MoaA/NifB/PqqE/SkfB family radical SAM enzyme
MVVQKLKSENDCKMSHTQSKLSPIEIEKRNHLKINKPRVYEKVMNYAEKINKGESVAILQFQYDYRCNFRCQHCCTSKMEKKRRHFSIEDVRELSRQADEIGLAHVTITGGEPLLFPDLDELVEAIDPYKFYIAVDSNGWLLDNKKAKHLKSIGIEKVHLSLDSISAAEHDNFRRKPGSHERVLKSIEASLDAGLSVLLNTVVTKQRAHSQEFIDFLEFTKKLGVGVVMMLAKPAGEWEGNVDVILNEDDLAYVRELEKHYNAFTHLVPAYGLDLGCIAVKRMVSITRYGDVMPCPWIHISLGNFFEEPLKVILERGMNIRFFGKRMETCLGSVDGEFLRNYTSKIWGKSFPVPYSEIFTKEDFLK